MGPDDKHSDTVLLRVVCPEGHGDDIPAPSDSLKKGRPIFLCRECRLAYLVDPKTGKAKVPETAAEAASLGVRLSMAHDNGMCVRSDVRDEMEKALLTGDEEAVGRVGIEIAEISHSFGVIIARTLIRVFVDKPEDRDLVRQFKDMGYRIDGLDRWWPK